MRNARCDYVGISNTQWYPIWLSYCGALLEEHGHDVKLVDAPAAGLDHEQALTECVAFAPDWLVVYSSTKSQASDIAFASRVKAAVECKVVFVGPFVSIDPEAIVQGTSVVDCVIRGEFDFPMLELVDGQSYDKVRNLVYRKNGTIVANDVRPLLSQQELDSFPWVTDFYRRHLDLRRYQVPQELYPFVDLFTGRGCAWGLCTFCLWVHSFIPGRVYNTRSIENVIGEVDFVEREIPQAKEIFIQDDMFPPERAREFSEALLAEGLDVTWGCYLKGNVDYKTLQLMKKAGCRTVHVGYESASPAILKNIRKGITVEQMTRFTQDAARAGLLVHGDFVFGLPGETEESIVETIAWAKSLELTTAQFSLMNPYPTTPYYTFLAEHDYLRDGEPSYPHLSNEDIRHWAKRAYAEFYFRWRYMKDALLHPYERIISQRQAIWEMIKHIFWKRW
jgi:radical SAM superfamily enzyme YgiQ (UPF0313 family)